MGHRKKCVSKSFIRRKSETFGCSEHKGVLSRRVFERREKLGCAVQTETEECIDQTAGTTRSSDCLSFLAEAEMKAVDPDQRFDMDDSDADDFEVIPDTDAAVLTGSTRPDIGMETVPLPVPEDAMEVDFDAGVEPVLVRRGTKRASPMREERADQTDVEVCPDTTGA